MWRYAAKGREAMNEVALSTLIDLATQSESLVDRIRAAGALYRLGYQAGSATYRDDIDRLIHPLGGSKEASHGL